MLAIIVPHADQASAIRGFRPSWHSRLSAVAAVMGCLLLGASWGSAGPVYLGGGAGIVPDFYQHQNSGFDGTNRWGAPALPPDNHPNPFMPSYTNGNWWEYSGGWCFVTGFVDDFYVLNAQGRTNLFDHSPRGPADQGKTPVQRMNYATEDFANQLFKFSNDPGGNAKKYNYNPVNDATALTAYGMEYGYCLGLNRYTAIPDPTTATGIRIQFNGVNTPYDSFAQVYTQGIQANQMPIVIMNGFNPETWWWSPASGEGEAPVDGFHTLAGAGFDNANGRLYYADPNETVNGANWGHPFAAGAAYPVGSANYGWFTLGTDGMTINGGSTVNSVADFYNNARIVEIDFIVIVPEPGSFILAVLGLIGLSHGAFLRCGCLGGGSTRQIAVATKG